jgi:hypothetical protein
VKYISYNYGMFLIYFIQIYLESIFSKTISKLLLYITFWHYCTNMCLAHKFYGKIGVLWMKKTTTRLKEIWAGWLFFHTFTHFLLINLLFCKIISVTQKQTSYRFPNTPYSCTLFLKLTINFCKRYYNFFKIIAIRKIPWNKR